MNECHFLISLAREQGQRRRQQQDRDRDRKQEEEQRNRRTGNNKPFAQVFWDLRNTLNSNLVPGVQQPPAGLAVHGRAGPRRRRKRGQQRRRRQQRGRNPFGQRDASSSGGGLGGQAGSPASTLQRRRRGHSPGQDFQPITTRTCVAADPSFGFKF